MKKRFSKLKYDTHGSQERFHYYSSNRKTLSPKPKVSLKKDGVFALFRSNIFAVLIVGVIAASGVYILYLEPKPRVILGRIDGGNSSLIVSRSPEMYSSTVYNLLQQNILNRTKITINTQKVRTEILEMFPELLDARISVPLVGKKPVVKLEFSKGAYLVKSEQKTYILGRSGKVLLELDNATHKADLSELLVITDESEVGINVGEHILNEQALSFISNVVAQLMHAKIEIAKVVLPQVPNEMRIYPKNSSHYVKFAFDGDPRLQTGSFIAFWQTNQVSDGDQPRITQYIDVRVQGKVYYK